MSNIVLGINQGDFIYYYNLSTGDVDRDWLFQGGTPTGGTGYLPAIQYNSVNLTGYDSRLTVTGYGGVQRTELKSKIIVVYPEVFSVNMVIAPPNTGMGSPVEYIFTGGTGSGVASYSWVIPELGGVTGATLSSVTYTAEDWYTLTGTYSGSPNASFLTSGTLACISNVGNNATTSSPVTYRKIGPVESVNYWRQGGTGIYATSGQYYDPNIYPFTTSAIGIGGNNIILQIDQNPYYPLCWNNEHFHSTDEVAYFYSNSLDGGFTIIKFRMILSGATLDSMGILYGTSPEISFGNYIKPGDVHSKLDDSVYLTDYLTTGGGSSLTSLSAAIGTGNRDWSNVAITEYLTNYYYASGSSKYIETGGYTANKTPVRNLVSVVAYVLGMQGYNWGGTGGTPPSNFHGVSVLSSQGGDDLYSSAGVIDIAIVIYDESGLVLGNAVIVLSDGGDPGNSYDGRMILAQDTPYNTGLGIKSLINNHFAAIGWDDYLVVEEAEWFAPYQNGGSTTGPRYDSNNFHGLRVSIKEPLYYGDYIQYVSVDWGPGYASFLSSVNGTIPTNQYTVLASPFASVNTSKASKQSWTGIPNLIYPANSSSYQDYFKGWQYGGAL